MWCIKMDFITNAIFQVFTLTLVFSQEIYSGIELHDAEVRLQNDLLKDYNLNVLPPHTSSTPIVVQFGQPIISVQELNAQTQTLTTECWLKMLWTDSRLTWEENNYSGIRELKFSGHEIWQPPVQLLNSARLSEIDEFKWESVVFVSSNGDVTWSTASTLYTHCEVSLKKYPYDIHTCFFKFGSWTYHGYHIDVDLHPNMTESGFINGWNMGGEWAVVGSKVNKSTLQFDGKPYSDVTFYLTLQRRSPFYKVATLCPLIAIVFLILASFWISPVFHQRITLNAVTFLALILLVLHLTSKLPAVGADVPLIMTFCGILVILISMLMMVSIFFMNFIESKHHNQTPLWINMVLESRFAKWLWISNTKADFETFSNPDETPTAQTDNKSKATKNSAKHNLILFFQFVDRIVFIVCLIVIISIMIAASS